MDKLITIPGPDAPAFRPSHPPQVLAQWLAGTLIADPGYEIRWTVFYQRYLDWCYTEGWKPLAPTRLGILIEAQRSRRNSETYILGARLS